MPTSSRRIEDLHPDFQPMVRELHELGNAAMTDGWQFFITDGFRSMQRQQALYNQGRTTPGNIVTNARPGESAHNYGLAVDMAFQRNGKLSYDRSLYNKVYPIARELGFVLGADWKSFPDGPHFEYPNWKAKAKEPMPSTPTLEDGISRVVVTASQGLNVRSEPTTSAKIVTALPKGTGVLVREGVIGESVAGNDRWWLTKNRYYVWSGATSLIPEVKEEKPAPSPTPQPTQPAAVDSSHPVVVELNKTITEQQNIINKQVIELSNKDNELLDARAQTSVALQRVEKLEAVKVVNESLSETLELYEAQMSELQKRIKRAYAYAFTGWEFYELPKAALNVFKLVPLFFQLSSVILGSTRENYVIGWKKGAVLHTTKDEVEAELD